MTRAGIIAALLTVLAAGAAEAQSPIEGRWTNEGQPAGRHPPMRADPVRHGGQGFGQGSKARAERGSGTELIGAHADQDIRPVGPSSYRAKVFVPDRNVNASGKIRQARPTS